MADFTFVGEECSIVLIGAFNPSLFHPAWLVNNGLVSREEAFIDEGQTPRVGLVHAEFTQFNLALGAIEVYQNRFLLRTNDASNFIRARDLVLGIFTILSHTPISQIGINLTQSIEFSSEELWNNVGHIFAPKDIWAASMAGRLGLKELKIQCVERDDGLFGAINLKIWPIAKKSISIEVNNHIELFDASREKTVTLKAVLEDHWDQCLDIAYNIINTSVSEAVKHACNK